MEGKFGGGGTRLPERPSKGLIFPPWVLTEPCFTITAWEVKGSVQEGGGTRISRKGGRGAESAQPMGHEVGGG